MVKYHGALKQVNRGKIPWCFETGKPWLKYHGALKQVNHGKIPWCFETGKPW